VADAAGLIEIKGGRDQHPIRSVRDHCAMVKVDERATVPVIARPERERLARALDRDPVAAAYLFGSQASGGAGPLSDVDIAVVLVPGFAGAEVRSELFAAIVEALGTGEVDLVLADSAPPLLRHRIVRNGLRLVDRTPHVRVRFETRALLDYLDTLYLREVLSAGRRRRLGEGSFGRR